MATQQVVPAVCPKCGTQYTAPALSLIDVTNDPALKQAFMQGQLNVAQCPNCGTVHPLNVPILYHDAEKELALVFVPNSMGIAHTDEQKIIGRLTTQLMNSLPPEKRKGYLLNPRIFISMENLYKAILAADGITEEMIAAQQSKMKLIDQLLHTRDEATVKKLIEDNKDQFDYQFFEIITSLALQALQSGDEVSGQTLLGFRQFVAQAAGTGAEHIAAIDEKIGLRALSPESLLDSLRQAKTDEEFKTLIAEGKPLLTYEFFQSLTQKIEAANAAGDAAETEALQSLRSRIMETSAALDKEARAALENAGNLLDGLFQAEDPDQFIAENIEKFDEPFLTILVANIQEAEKAGRKDIVEKLGDLYNRLMAALQANLPPEMRLLNELIAANAGDRIAQKLAENKKLVTPALLELLGALRTDIIARGEGTLIPVLDEIKRQIEAMLNGNDSPPAGGKILIAR
ncbi:MAG TPA: hypothetical protein ENJ48_01770 [Anaerolineae bacterium]|nr:hypothetical protein [Anaerolineae bacterium]